MVIWLLNIKLQTNVCSFFTIFGNIYVSEVDNLWINIELKEIPLVMSGFRLINFGEHKQNGASKTSILEPKKCPLEVVYALTLIKKAAAIVNHELGKLAEVKMKADCFSL